MKFSYRTLSPLLLLCTLTLSSQDTWHGTMSGMQMMYNPAFAGVRGTPSVNLSAFTFLPGKGFSLRSVYASYDGYYPGLHGGAGVWLSDDMFGDVMNDLRGGLSYSYHFRAGRKTYISRSTTARASTPPMAAFSIPSPSPNVRARSSTTGATACFQWTG